MRKLLSILLLVLIGLPFATPLFALGSESSLLPACCRRAGDHHCAMAAAMSPSGSETTARARMDCCPLYPRALATGHSITMAGPMASAGLVPLAQREGGVVQTESRWRMARDRSRQKRGPPTA